MISGTQLIEKVLFKIAKQWIAGNTVDDALNSAKRLTNHEDIRS